MDVIQKQRETRGVLVYANGEVLEELKKVGDFEVVAVETSDGELRSMGLKKDNKYRVKLISKDYGDRGLDYRSIENLLGICLIVLSPCMSEREWLQLLNRVGRYDEQCFRIVNSKIEKVDEAAYMKFVGKVKHDLNKIKEENSPSEDDGLPLIKPKGNDRFEERQMKLAEQDELL